MQTQIDSCCFNISDFLFRSAFRSQTGSKVGYRIFVPDSFSRSNDNKLVLLDQDIETEEVNDWLQRDYIMVIPDDAEADERAEFEEWLKFAFAAELVDPADYEKEKAIASTAA